MTIKSNRGQLSIFMGITLILVMSLLAFVINVGLFVKAKINLQNSVDAAAYAGAAVQARQLSNIAYLNWEMRNTFKEWMFKYYILGQLGLMTNHPSDPSKSYNLSSDKLASNGAQTRFLLTTPPADVAGTGGVGFDAYNAPSICIHNNSLTNICPIATLPGIPRFPAIGVAGISEIHEAFVNALVKEKGANCSDRTQINFLAAMSWAYSSGIRAIPGAPLVATNRPGAWPQTLELGMRMRNLEMIVNRPPITTPMDLTAVNALAGQGADIGLNERPIKAFMSAFRNLSGGKYKSIEDGKSKDEFASSFKLVELQPRPFDASAAPVSSFLIPTDKVMALQKYYLDLQVVPLNYATMFTTFATTKNEFEPSIASEAACNVSKTAMPVPGYLLGFVKNPAVLTYYAVKGEAEFTGLFYPGSSGSVKLTAYAAAKPFGGRIGPRLFDFRNNSSVIARQDTSKRSASYFSAFKIPLAAASGFKAGMPIPASQDFWADAGNIVDNVGGVPLLGGVKYGLPNMIYDFNDFSDLQYQATDIALKPLTLIEAKITENMSTSERVGLYHSEQFKLLKSNFAVNAGTTVTGEQVMAAIVKARGATKYDALNYLIPDHRLQPNDDDNIVPIIKALPEPVQGGEGVNYALFAPLIGDNLLYGNTNEIVTVVNKYIEANKGAVEIYLKGLLDVGQSIYSINSQGGASVNALAAQSIHVNAGTGPGGTAGPAIPAFLVSADPNNALDVTCKRDMASKFYHFFAAGTTQCGIVPLELLMGEFINKQSVDDGKLYYKTTYFNSNAPGKLMTAFYPGPRQDVAPDGRVTHPITRDQQYLARRNTYSTKFFNMAKVMENAPGETNKGDFDGEIFKEDALNPPLDMAGVNMLNPLIYDAASGLNNKFYLDF